MYESQELTDELLDEADLVIVLTDHPNVDYQRVVDRAEVVYDTRGVTESIAFAARTSTAPKRERARRLARR